MSGGRELRTWARAGTFALACLLAACGDTGDDPGPPRNPSPAAEQAPPAAGTRAEFVKALDTICRSGNREIRPLQREAARAQERGDFQGVAAAYEEALPTLDAGIQDQAELRPSGSDRSAFRGYLRAQRRIRGLYDRLIRSLRAEDVETAEFIVQNMARERKRRLEAALDLGARECGG